MDIADEQRVMSLFEMALDLPPAVRTERLRDLLTEEPDILAAVLGMLQADSDAAMLPTQPSAPVQLVDDAPQPERIGSYRIIEEIGRGGMGLVYRAARDDGLFDQQVAIKVIRRTIFSAATREQFATERRILARLHHPHIAQLLDGGMSDDGSPYIIMELIRGVAITDHAADRSLGLLARLALFRDACEALEYAHRELVVHADVKPSNVVVAEGFGVKLLDFGIARLLGDENGLPVSAHTPGFSSPARQSGARATPADDVFALGVLLDRLIEGLVQADADLRAVAAKAADPDAARRYGAVSELIADLDRWQRHEPVSARPPGWGRWLALLVRRNLLWVIAGALLVLTSLVTTALYLQADHDRTMAERRFADVRSMANYMMFDLDPQMARLAGALPARRSAAARASGYLQALGADARSRPELALEIARSHLRLANIYGYDATGGLNDFPQARRQLAAAAALLGQVPAGAVRGGELSLALGELELTRAAAALVEQTEASLPRAQKALDQAAVRFDESLRDDPGRIEADYGRWRTAIYRIRLELLAGRTTQAVALGRTTMAQKHPIPATPGQQVDFDFLTGAGWTGLAQAQYEAGDYPAALASFARAREALASILAADRGGFETRNYLSIALAGIADCHERLGRLTEALSFSEQGLAILLEIRRQGPNDSLDEDIMATRIHLAGQYAKAKRPRDAIAQIDAAINQLQQRVKADPAVAANQRALAVAIQGKATVLFRLGQDRQACATTEAALAQWRVADRMGGVVAMDRVDNTGLSALNKRLQVCGISARL